MDFWSLALGVLLDTLKDSCIVFAIVLTLHVLLSFFEGKLASLLKKNKRYAPVLGSLFGIVPECGTSVVGADLYLKGHLTMGTLVAIFLACSDEALPIMFGNFSSTWWMAFLMIGCKIAIGALVGTLVDLFMRKQDEAVEEHMEHCHGDEDVHIGCCGHEVEEENPWKEHLLHPLLHSLKILAYVIVISFAFGLLVGLVGEENIMGWLSSNRYWSPLMAIAVGLIPNCASSVMLSELWLEGALPFASLLSGLLVNAGLGVFVLLKSKKKLKESFLILGICVLTAAIAGYGFLFIPGLG